MSFVSPSLLNNIGSTNRSIADAEPYGVVQVDDAGVVQLYNKYESDMAGFEPSFSEGRNFFTQIAPCSNNRLFFGRFKEGVAKGSMNDEFKYTFTYKMRPTPVEVHLFRDAASSTNWVFVKKVA